MRLEAAGRVVESNILCLRKRCGKLGCCYCRVVGGPLGHATCTNQLLKIYLSSSLTNPGVPDKHSNTTSVDRHAKHRGIVALNSFTHIVQVIQTHQVSQGQLRSCLYLQWQHGHSGRPSEHLCQRECGTGCNCFIANVSTMHMFTNRTRMACFLWH